MEIRSLPDLASTLRLQDRITGLRSELDSAGAELTTGVSADILTRTGGDLVPLFGIDADLSRLADAELDLGLASARAAAAQSSLGVVQESVGDLGISLLSAVSTGDTGSQDIYINQASSVLDAGIQALNTQFGGRSLFGGAAVEGVPMASAETLLADVSAIVAAAPDAATALADVDTYFDAAGGGFETNIYQGSDIDAPGAIEEDGSRISYLVRADDQAIRDTLKAVALAAVAEDASFIGDPTERGIYLGATADQMITARDEVTNLRATVGNAEAQIGTAQTRVESQIVELSVARTEIAGVDQYNAAARFSELEGQLQTLFLVTGRLSSLSLTNFLR